MYSARRVPSSKLHILRKFVMQRADHLMTASLAAHIEGAHRGVVWLLVHWWAMGQKLLSDYMHSQYPKRRDVRPSGKCY